MNSNRDSEPLTFVLGKRTRNDGQDGKYSGDASESSSPGGTEEISADNAAESTVGSSLNPSPFACTYEGCTKAFATTAHRKRHERSHTGILPYACPLCGKRFARSDVRGRHITGIHEKDPAKVLKGSKPRQGGKHADAPQPPSIWPGSEMAIGVVQHDVAIQPGRSRLTVSGPVEPYLTNNRITSQILQPASLPSAESGNNGFDSPLSEQRVSGHDTFPSPGFGTHGHFTQPIISHLAGPSQHPNMEMLLQAVSTSHWTDSMQGKHDFPIAPPPQESSAHTAQLSQIPTGFISLDLPAASVAPGDLAGGDMADVFGWGVNNTDWMKLYDSIDMDADTTMDTTSGLPLELPGTYGVVDQSSFVPHDASGSPIWTMPQQPSSLPVEMAGMQRCPSNQRQPNRGTRLGFSSEPRGSYILPSELPDHQEVYPSRTSRINRDMTYVSENHDPGSTGPSYSATKKVSQANSQSGQQGPDPALISVKKGLALPNPVSQSLPSSEFPAYVGSRHHSALLRLINFTHEPTFPPPDLANFPDPGVMSTCVGLYFEHFHPILPVLRPAAFQDLDRSNQEIPGASSIDGVTSTVPASNIVEYQNHPYYPFLLLTMCAIGATYAKRDWKPVAIYMNELARRAGKHLRDRDSRAVFSKQYMQARLLQAVAGLAIGSRDLYLESEMTRSVLVAAARRANLLRSMKASTQDTPPHAFSPLQSGASGTGSSHDAPGRAVEKESGEELQARWYRWLEEEERRRLGWGIYIVDSQGASVLNVPASFALDEIHAAMPSTKELWTAPTAAAWDAAVKRAHRSDPDSTEAQPFDRVLRDALQEGLLPRTVSDFGKNIIAHTLHRICNEASALNKLLIGDSLVTLEELRKSSFPPNLQHDPYALLEKLAISWHDSVEYPSYFLISNDAMRHHASLKLIHPQFLDHVKYAAGQWEWDASKTTARQWLREWLAENPESSRRIIVHCAQMAALLSRFSKDTCWEPVWTLDCCLAWWAVMKFGNADCLNRTVTEKTADRRLLIKWSDPPDRVERWIATGGQVMFQGMPAEVTTRSLLIDFISKLEAMPWSVSRIYGSVLARLLAEEGEE